MNDKDFTRLDDAMLKLVSGGKAVSVIDGFSFYVTKEEKNKIFKWQVWRGDKQLMSEHMSRHLAENAQKNYYFDQWENQNPRYDKLNNIVRQKIHSDD